MRHMNVVIVAAIVLRIRYNSSKTNDMVRFERNTLTGLQQQKHPITNYMSADKPAISYQLGMLR